MDPFALVFLAAWLLAILARLIHADLRRRRQDRYENRFQRGLCLSCGYDLRGADRRCPECGKAIDPRDP